MTVELWRLGAVELSRLFGTRDLSPVEVLEATLARIERINPTINAIVALNERGARATAAASERRWRAGEAWSPLDGVPITVKDNIPVKGLPATWGSRLFADFVPERDELPVARLRRSGAAILGKTNVPELTLQGYTDNELFGPTRNPWDPRLTPGGSSGGAVAAVAAGLGPLAIGTDGGGSIRRPAGYTGLVGLKPSTGRVARLDGFPAILLDCEVIGPIARTVADAAALFGVLAGPDRRDRNSLLLPAPERHTDRRRILYVPRFGSHPVDPVVAASVATAARRLAELGHVVEQGEAPFDLAELDEIWAVVTRVGAAAIVERAGGDERRRVGPAIAAMAAEGAAIGATRYFRAIEAMIRFRAAMAELFERSVDAVLTPSSASMPWPADRSHPPEIDGRPVGPRGHAVFTGWVNLCGHPAITLPADPAPSGSPIGIQLVGAFGADDSLLDLAAAYEARHGWAERWPALARS